MFTVLSALAFSLAVCALLGVGFTTLVTWVVDVVSDVRDRVAFARRRRSTADA